jgi:tetratricopeptide (TPR) repeat protein
VQVPAQHVIQAIWLRHPTNMTINTLMEEGCQQMSLLGPSQEALANFEEAAALDPTFAEAWNKIATIQYLQQQYAAPSSLIVVTYNGAVRLRLSLLCQHYQLTLPAACHHIEHIGAYGSSAGPMKGPSRQARTRLLLFRYSQSIESCEHVIRLNPQHYLALSGKGMCHVKLGEYEKARECWRAALEINPFLTQLRRYLSASERGEAEQ